MVLGEFAEIWLCDFEYHQSDGGLPHFIVCMVAHEFHSEKTLKFWSDDLYRMKQVPFETGPRSCFVAYNAVAELNCFLALGWKFPTNVIDIYPEYLNISNGLRGFRKGSLLSAMQWFKQPSISAIEKKEVIELIISKRIFSAEECERILDYCASDSECLRLLLPSITEHPYFNVKFALTRGRYMKAVCRVEAVGIPIDNELFDRLDVHWRDIKLQAIREKDSRFRVYNNAGEFSHERLEECLKRLGITWPYRTKGGRKAKPKAQISDEVFERMAKVHPILTELRQLRRTLSELKLNKIQIGPDGRNRCSTFPFTTLTSRNAPSNTKFIFGPAKWVRWLIKPREGFGLAYIDYKAQEVGIAASLSQDPVMKAAYLSGEDCYLSYAKRAGAVPADATDQELKRIRKFFKQTILGTMYGKTAWGLARDFETMGLSEKEAEEKAAEILGIIKTLSRKYCNWSEAAYDYASLNHVIHTRFGWYFQLTPKTLRESENTLRNFPMQANGAEILRLACSYVTERDIRVCAMIHDALLIEAPIDELEYAIAVTRASMKRAGEVVLKGFPLETDVDRVIYPNRYQDEDGEEMWNEIQRLLKAVCPNPTECERCQHGKKNQ